VKPTVTFAEQGTAPQIKYSNRKQLRYDDHESEDSAHKTRRWLNESPTPKQLQYLPPELRADFGLTRYQASALLSFRFNRNAIVRLVNAANDAHAHQVLEVA